MPGDACRSNLLNQLDDDSRDDDVGMTNAGELNAGWSSLRRVTNSALPEPGGRSSESASIEP
jgi:hypothetical protein